MLACFSSPAPMLHADEPVPHRWPPRLLLNSDCGTPVFYKFDAPMSESQLCRVVNDLPGTQVDAFLPCPQFSDDQFWFPTRVGEPYDGRHVQDDRFEDRNFKRVADHVRSLNERGIDPMRVWQRRARGLGLLFVPSLRMNDVHKDYVDRWPSLRSHWETQRKHLLIGEAIPAWYKHPYTFSWAMDYAHEEVRRRKLDIITEICTRYEVDGFDLDFLRHVYYFRRGQEADGAELMNEFVRSVRKRLDEIGEAKGKRLRLLVRVPPQIHQCERIGLDVSTWIRSGWVDMVTAMAPGYLDMDADIASFADLANGTGCVIAGGLEYYVRGYKKTDKEKSTSLATLQMLRAGAASFWAQGASSIYLFNYDCHGPFPFRGQKRQALMEVGDPARLAGRDKRYLVTVDMEVRTPEEGGDKQLPVTLDEKHDRRALHVFVADDPASARARGSTVLVQLTVTGTGVRNLQVSINGSNAEPAERSDSRLLFRSPPVVWGRNTVELRRVPDATGADSRVTGVDLQVRYPA